MTRKFKKGRLAAKEFKRAIRDKAISVSAVLTGTDPEILYIDWTGESSNDRDDDADDDWDDYFNSYGDETRRPLDFN